MAIEFNDNVDTQPKAETPQNVKNLKKHNSDQTAQVSKKASDNAPATDPTAKPLEFHTVDDPGAVVTTTLLDFVSIDEIPVLPNARRAMRTLNEKQVDKLVLALESGAKLPPIRLTPTNYGDALIDGQHRLAAHARYLRNTVVENAGGLDMTDEDVDKQVASLIPEYPIDATLEETHTPRELLQKVFTANFNHGLGANDISRVRYVIWQLEMQNEDITAGRMSKDDAISMRQLSIMAGCHHSSVSRQLQRDRERNEKMFDSLNDDDKATVTDDVEAEKAESQKSPYELDEKAMKSLIAAAKHFDSNGTSYQDIETFVKGYARALNEGESGILLHIVRTLDGEVTRQGQPVQQSLGSKVADNQEYAATVN